MKIPKNLIRSRKRLIPALNFADHDLTSFAGMFIFQKLFNDIDLAKDLRKACSSLSSRSTRQYHHGSITFLLTVHLILGFRKLRDTDYYRDDPMIKHVLNLKKLPSVPTLSRMLNEFDKPTVQKLHQLNTDSVIDRLVKEDLVRITMDFDGTVLSTTRHAEGAAVGFNKVKKGDLSYYPLMATIAQTTQIFDFLHRSGNLHDSNGSVDFVKMCIERVKADLPHAKIEVRMDSAFNTIAMIEMLESKGVEYSISVAFERLAELKGKIESRKRWKKCKNKKGTKIGYFEETWKPKSWPSKQRYIFVRTPTKKQRKGPLQLDLFEPVDFENRYKVIVTNRKTSAANVISFHEGRGTQEKCFGEAKSQASLGYIPCRSQAGNEVFLLCSALAYNLNRELQMQNLERDRPTTEQRQPLWVFEELNTIRNGILRTAGRLTRPQGKLTLTLPKSKALQKAIARFLPEPTV